jgi:hypothetical protein
MRTLYTNPNRDKSVRAAGNLPPKGTLCCLESFWRAAHVLQTRCGSSSYPICGNGIQISLGEQLQPRPPNSLCRSSHSHATRLLGRRGVASVRACAAVRRNVRSYSSHMHLPQKQQ